MKTISTVADFEDSLPIAIARMDELIHNFSGDPMLESIQRQLKFVQIWTQDHVRPTHEQVEKLSFGIMASKSVQEIDEECADLLHELSYFLHNWPES